MRKRAESAARRWAGRAEASVVSKGKIQYETYTVSKISVRSHYRNDGSVGLVATQRWEMEKRGAVVSHAEQGKLRNRRRRIELGLVSGKASNAVSQPGGAGGAFHRAAPSAADKTAAFDIMPSQSSHSSLQRPATRQAADEPRLVCTPGSCAVQKTPHAPLNSCCSSK